MIEPAFYNALGRIRKLLVFSVPEYDIKMHNPLAQILGDLLDIKKILLEKDITVCIVFDYKQTDQMPDLESIKLVQFIAAEKSDCSVNSKWTQDSIHIVPDEDRKVKILYIKKGPAVIEECIRMALEKKRVLQNLEPLDEMCDGGNVMRGRSQDGLDYLLVGSKTYCDIDESVLAEKFNADKVFRFSAFCFSESTYEKVFFHLDLYTTIVGKCPGNRFDGKEVLLLADGYSPNQLQIKKFNDCVDVAWNALQTQSQGMFRCVKTPVIIVEMPDGKNFSYSFCNCIVENYLNENRDHMLNIYFPEFKEQIPRDYDALNSSIDKRMFYNQIEKLAKEYSPHSYRANKLIRAMDVIYDFDMEDSFFDSEIARVMLNENVKSIDVWIKDKLTEVTNEIGATFNQIDIDYAEDTRERFGSLHCRVKVMERDFVNINPQKDN